MRVFAISDLHVDYEENFRWVLSLSNSDHTNDILIVAGDMTDLTNIMSKAFQALRKKFLEVLYVPGNHDLWVIRNKEKDSFARLKTISQVAQDTGVTTGPYHNGSLSFVPLQGWYDYSFGQPNGKLASCWADFRACVWPDNQDEKTLTSFFLKQNLDLLNIRNQTIITFSHFMPRIDIMPSFIPMERRFTYPILGTELLDLQIRQLNPSIHVYGHSHLNLEIHKDNIHYINNAFGYPHEKRISRKRLICIHDTAA